MVKEILLLGNPLLYKKCEAILPEENELVRRTVEDLHDTLVNFRKKYQAGRAIAAPQIGIFKNLVYMHTDEPEVFINPSLSEKSDEMIELWDDCMSFPGLLVKVKRHSICRITYRDINWKEKSIRLSGSLSELLQHETDHLDGILAVSRAIDAHSFAFQSEILTHRTSA